MAEQSEEASRFILFRLFRLHRKHMALHELDRLVFDRPFWPNVVDSWSHDDQVYLAMSRCFQVTRVPWLPKRRPFLSPFFRCMGLRSPVSLLCSVYGQPRRLLFPSRAASLEASQPMQDLEMKAADRRFYAGLLQERSGRSRDSAMGPCGPCVSNGGGWCGGGELLRMPEKVALLGPPKEQRTKTHQTNQETSLDHSGLA